MTVVFSVTILVFSVSVFAQFDPNQCNKEENESDCHKRLDYLAKEIKILEQQKNLENSTQKKIGVEINKLNTEIKKTSSHIKKKNTLINTIKRNIFKKKKNLKNLNEKLRREKESLEKILRKRYEIGDTTLLKCC